MFDYDMQDVICSLSTYISQIACRASHMIFVLKIAHSFQLGLGDSVSQ